MFQALFTDFLRSKTVQKGIVTSLLCDLILFQSIKHTFILFGLPYVTSVILCCRYTPRKKFIKARVSRQYKNKKVQNFKPA